MIKEFAKHFSEIFNPKRRGELHESANEHAPEEGFSRDSIRPLSFSISSLLSSFLSYSVRCARYWDLCWPPRFPHSRLCGLPFNFQQLYLVSLDFLQCVHHKLSLLSRHWLYLVLFSWKPRQIWFLLFEHVWWLIFCDQGWILWSLRFEHYTHSTLFSHNWRDCLF